MVITINDVDAVFDEFTLSIKNQQNNNEINMHSLKEAYLFARKAHENQFRASKEPFISHPLEVAKIVYEYGLDEASLIASLLHDVVEDTDCTLNEVIEKFGNEVGMIVDGLTKIKTFTEDREEKNVETLRKILLASAKDIRVLIIKLCDRLHNLRTLSQMPVEKQERISRETMLIYAPIAQKVGIYSLKWELEDLAFKYRNPEMFQLIKTKIKLRRTDREKIVNRAVNEIKAIIDMNGDFKNIVILGRPKNFYSIYKKIKDKAKSFDEIYDLYAIRIIVPTIADCYTILGLLHENSQTFPDRLKDYIANPKANGYQSIHTTIFSKVANGPVEIQIRTDDMHKFAEYGVAAHWKYKNLNEDKVFEKKIAWLREVLQWEKEHKDNAEFLNLLKYDFFQNEIYVFTPKNDVRFLPENSSVLDFAYAVHTEIGSKAYKAKVNGAFVNIDKVLKNGDIVEIITNNSVRPSDKWLKFVKTSKARIKIRDAINLKFRGNVEVKKTIDENSFETLKNKMTRIDEFKKVRKAGCCKLQYGDQIVGVIGKDKELVVHNASCDNAKYTLNKKIIIDWKEEKRKEVEIVIMLMERVGILMDVLNTMYKFNLNMSKLNTNIFKNGEVKLNIRVLDGPHIERLVKDLEEMESVRSVKIIKSTFFCF